MFQISSRTAALFLLFALAAGGPLVFAQAPPTEATKVDTKTATKELEALGEEMVLQGFMDPFDYEPRGRKDPFMKPMLDRPVAPGSGHGPLLPLQRFEIGQLKLIGVLWDVKRPRAMIQDPENRIHTVGPYTKIGTRHGYIAVIREGEIVVVETTEDSGGRLTTMAQIMKLVR